MTTQPDEFKEFDERLNQLDVDIMEWFYDMVKISFGVEMIQDSSGLRDIIEGHLQDISKHYIKRSKVKEVGEGMMKYDCEELKLNGVCGHTHTMDGYYNQAIQDFSTALLEKK